MLSTAFPLRVTADGRLAQGDALDGVLNAIRVMAGTTAMTWPHAKWFGLLELFLEAAARENQDHEALKDALNVALERLGATSHTVQAVTTGPVDGTGRRRFELTLVDHAGHVAFGTVSAA